MPAPDARSESLVSGRTAQARAEAWLGVAWLLFRLGYLATGVVVVLAVWPSFAHPQVELLLLLAVVVETAVLAAVLGRHRAAAIPAAVRVDVVVVCSGLIVNGYALGPAAIDSWFNWFFALSLGSAVGASVWLPSRQALAAVAAVAAAHCLPVLRPWTAGGATGVGQVVAYSLIGWLLAGKLRSSAAETDAARAEAVRLGEELERERARRLVHDPATVLRLLSQDNLSAAEAAPIRRQGGVLAARLHRYLATEAEPAIPFAVALTGLAEEFGDLPLTANIAGICRDVPAEVGEAIVAAVRTLLLNVRCHAQARKVVLYARVDQGGWEVSVCDDGRGFDPAVQPWGVGLREVVTSGVQAVGGAVTVTATPGEGTFISLRSAGV